MKEMFRRYVAIQFSGMYNMFMQGSEVMELIGCYDVMDYFYIMEHYTELKEKYPQEWEDGRKIGVEMSEKIHG